MEDYYKILGIPESAGQNEVRRAFREKAKCLHPDVNPGRKTHSEFQKVNEAYQVLHDRAKRQKYDLRIRHGIPYQKVYYRPGQKKYRAKGDKYAHYETSDQASSKFDRFEKVFDFILFITLLFIGCFSLIYGLYRLWFKPEAEINPYPGVFMGLFFTALILFLWKKKNKLINDKR